MIDSIKIRESLPDDLAAIEQLYPQAFPDEDLLPLVRELLSEQQIVLSLVGMAKGTLAGHVMFTACGVTGSTDTVALLGPLAVTPALQRQGIGSRLVREGLRLSQGAGTQYVCVLGDPAYYGRFGFERDDDIEPPYPLPEEWRSAWQSLSLSGSDRLPHGKLSLPPPWRKPALWAP